MTTPIDELAGIDEEFWRGRCLDCAHPEHEMTCHEMIPNGDPSNGPAYCPCASQIENMEREIIRLRSTPVPASNVSEGLTRQRALNALDSLDIIDGIVDDTHPEGDGCPLCHELDNLREVLSALAHAAPEGLGRDAIAAAWEAVQHSDIRFPHRATIRAALAHAAPEGLDARVAIARSRLSETHRPNIHTGKTGQIEVERECSGCDDDWPCDTAVLLSDLIRSSTGLDVEVRRYVALHEPDGECNGKCSAWARLLAADRLSQPDATEETGR